VYLEATTLKPMRRRGPQRQVFVVGAGTAGAATLKTAKQDKVALVFAEKSLLQCADNYSRSAHNRSIVGFQPVSALGESLTTGR
jgi:hypothetical protein